MRVQRTVLGCKNTRAYVHSKVVNYGDKKSTYIGIDFFSSVTLECKILEFFLLWHSSLTDSRQEAMNWCLKPTFRSVPFAASSLKGIEIASETDFLQLLDRQQRQSSSKCLDFREDTHVIPFFQPIRCTNTTFAIKNWRSCKVFESIFCICLHVKNCIIVLIRGLFILLFWNSDLIDSWRKHWSVFFCWSDRFLTNKTFSTWLIAPERMCPPVEDFLHSAIFLRQLPAIGK